MVGDRCTLLPRNSGHYIGRGLGGAIVLRDKRQHDAGICRVTLGYFSLSGSLRLCGKAYRFRHTDT